MGARGWIWNLQLNTGNISKIIGDDCKQQKTFSNFGRTEGRGYSIRELLAKKRENITWPHTQKRTWVRTIADNLPCQSVKRSHLPGIKPQYISWLPYERVASDLHNMHARPFTTILQKKIVVLRSKEKRWFDRNGYYSCCLVIINHSIGHLTFEPFSEKCSGHWLVVLVHKVWPFCFLHFHCPNSSVYILSQSLINNIYSKTILCHN